MKTAAILLIIIGINTESPQYQRVEMDSMFNCEMEAGLWNEMYLVRNGKIDFKREKNPDFVARCLPLHDEGDV